MRALTEKYPTTVGIETTWIHNKADRESRYDEHMDCLNSYNAKSRAVATQLSEKKTGYYGCSRDWACLEVSSPRLRTRKAMRKWWTTVRDVTRANALTITHDDEMSGGAHIHLGLGRNTKRETPFLFNLVRDMYNRPYLNWVFNEPYDYENANWVGQEWWPGFQKNPFDPDDYGCFCSYCRHPQDYPRFSSSHKKEWMERMEKARRLAQDPDDNVDNLPDGKDVAFRYDSGTNTVEFRFFDMPWNVDEQDLHVEFALRYFTWIKRRTNRGEKIGTLKKFNRGKTPKFRTVEAVRQMTAAECIREFKRLLRVLDLEWDDYKVFVNRNLKVRLRFKNKKFKA